MHSFIDTQGRPWKITLNIGVIRVVKAELDVDLLDIGSGHTLARLADDPIALCDLLWVLVRDQAAGQTGASGPFTDVDFAYGLAGDVIAHATTALLQELVDFFPNPRRQALARLLEKTAALEQAAVDLVVSRLEDPKIEASLEQLLNSGSDSGKTPASSD